MFTILLVSYAITARILAHVTHVTQLFAISLLQSPEFLMYGKSDRLGCLLSRIESIFNIGQNKGLNI